MDNKNSDNNVQTKNDNHEILTEQQDQTEDKTVVDNNDAITENTDTNELLDEKEKSVQTSESINAEETQIKDSPAPENASNEQQSTTNETSEVTNVAMNELPNNTYNTQNTGEFIQQNDPNQIYNNQSNQSFNNAPYQNGAYDYNNNQKKKKDYKTIGIIALAVLALIAAVYFIGNATYPFKYISESEKIYIFENEDAKIDLQFENKSSDNRSINLKFSNYNENFTASIPAYSTEKMPVTFKNLTEDTTLKAKYGFMGLKSVKIDVVVLKKSDISFKTSGIRIYGEKNQDLSAKRFSAPNKEIKFSITGHNISGKEFIRKYDFKINGKVVDTVEAQWTGENISQTMINSSYTFKKEGKYTVEFGGIKSKFIVSKKHKVPNNGTILKSRGGGSGVLKIENRNPYDIIVSIALKGSPKVAQKRCYIKAKKSTSIYGIKSGTYILYVNNGEYYSNVTKNFLDKNTASKSKKLLPFNNTSSSYTVWTIKLGVTKGNMGSEGLSETDLPE